MDFASFFAYSLKEGRTWGMQRLQISKDGKIRMVIFDGKFERPESYS